MIWRIFHHFKYLIRLGKIYIIFCQSRMSLMFFLKSDFCFSISWTEAAKEGVSNWRKVWILIMAKNTLMMKGLLVLTNATSVNIPPLMQAIWGYIWKYTLEKNRTNATCVTMHPIMQAHWGHIWKRTVERSWWNVVSATMHPIRPAIWRHIWKHTVEKSQTNATSVKMYSLRQAIWGHIW